MEKVPPVHHLGGALNDFVDLKSGLLSRM